MFIQVFKFYKSLHILHMSTNFANTSLRMLQKFTNFTKVFKCNRSLQNWIKVNKCLQKVYKHKFTNITKVYKFLQKSLIFLQKFTNCTKVYKVYKSLQIVQKFTNCIKVFKFYKGLQI